MDLNRLFAPAVAVAGAAALVAGVWLVYFPAGLMVAGVLLLAAGFFLIDDGRSA